MTLKQFYSIMGANYDDVLRRLGGEALMRKLLEMLLRDNNMAVLKESVENRDYDQAFRAAHTIKGVCMNLGLSRLSQSAIGITECLRSRGSWEEAVHMFSTLEREYIATINAVNDLMASPQEEGEPK